jgi:hypothetical protein
MSNKTHTRMDAMINHDEDVKLDTIYYDKLNPLRLVYTLCFKEENKGKKKKKAYVVYHCIDDIEGTIIKDGDTKQLELSKFKKRYLINNS